MFRMILFCLLFFLSSVCQILPQYHITFNHLTVEDGLSQSAVSCIFQDRRGFMWFGTQDGLNRYDGYNFKIFKNSPSDSNSLTDNFIFSIYEDQSGVLYIETQSGNFHKFIPNLESFEIVNKDSVNLIGAKVSTQSAVYQELSGVIWTGGAGRGTGLERLDIKTGEVIHYKHNPADPFSLSADKVYSIYRDRSGNLWIGTVNGLDRLDELTGKFFHYVNDPGDPNSIADNWVWPIFEDSYGYLWIGTVRGGLSRFDPKTNTFLNYKNDPNDPTSINDNFIFSIYEDRSGVLWFGTNTGGVNYFHPASQVFDHYLHDPGNQNSLSDNNVIAINVDTKGQYWVGTRNGGLDKINPLKNLFSNYSQTSSHKLISNIVQVIYEDKSGIFWLGTFNSGLMEFDPLKETYKLYRNNPDDPNTISDNRIYSLIEDSEGFIWIGTYRGGLNKLDRNSGQITRYLFSDDDSTSISSNSVWSIIEDNTGNLWMGTFGSGINVLDKNRKIFKHFKHDPNDASSIGDDIIIRVFQDSKNNIWFGTTKGLSRFIKESNSFKNYREENGLANDFVFGILEDNNGNIWVSTNNGLSKFDPQNETFSNYYYQDGLLGNEFNQSAFAKDWKTGKLLFGGPNGLNVFHPDSLKDNAYLPPIVFTGYLRYNTDDEEGKPILEKGISERDSILLTYKDNIITLEFAAMSYFNNTDNQYKYKLEGFNENWIQLGTNHTVTFTNLSPGDYNLRVIGSNNDGLWNDEGASLFVEVTPPWWRTNIAYTIYGVIFIGILLGIRKFETDRREQKAQMRETELRMKATEAEKRAIEIENERKTKELEEARQLQLSMLPKEVPELPNLDIAAFMRTATEVGGDYYDFIVQENGVLNVAFGDATGHGLQAGTMVTLMKGFFTSDAAKLELQEFMNHCTSVIKEIKLGRILMSFSLLRFDNSKLVITSAGMPPIYYYSKKTENIEEIIIEGMPLGAMRKFSYKVIEKEVKSGDIILLLTDGLPEQMNDNEKMYDYPRVKEHFKQILNYAPNEIIESFVKSGDEWRGEAIQDDDISFVVIKVK
jgi:ligand-binding sensor domain-containing protein/serine phosphatase RsbU (regulator of sigma subunit)